MTFNWEGYVSLAEDLASSTDEARLRSCISRAYYGVFCIARNAKGYKDYKSKKGESIHWTVIQSYKTSSQIKEQDIGRILDKLRRSRNDADYKEDKPINSGLAQRAIHSAKQILASMGIP